MINAQSTQPTTLFLRPAFIVSAQPGTGLTVVVRAERPLQVPVLPPKLS